MGALKPCPNCGKREGKLANRRPTRFPYAVNAVRAAGRQTGCVFRGWLWNSPIATAPGTERRLRHHRFGWCSHVPNMATRRYERTV